MKHLVLAHLCGILGEQMKHGSGSAINTSQAANQSAMETC